ncbi:MAG: thiamine phosphate synthase [Pseudomonadota bacterium]
MSAAATRIKSDSVLPFSLVFFSSDKITLDPAIVARAGGEKLAIVFRHYELPLELRRRRALSLANVCRNTGTKLFVGNDVSIAKTVGAYGVHWSFRRGHPPTRPELGPLTLSIACHSLEEIKWANAARADLAYLSPVFDTTTHPDANPLGPQMLRSIAAEATMPVFALGGVNAANVNKLRNANIHGIAAIDAFSIDHKSRASAEQAPPERAR